MMRNALAACGRTRTLRSAAQRCGPERSHRGNRRQRLFDALIRAGGKLKPVLRDKFKAVEKVFRRNQRRRLLQQRPAR